MNIIHFKKIKSTNLYARENLEKLNLPVIIFAETQTGGMGRMGRLFHSPEGGLYMTYVDRFEAPLISMIVPLGITEALIKRGVEAGILWPNDIILNGKKLGGILIERVEGVYLIGIGINCNTTREDFPVDLRGRITTLKEETGRKWNITELGIEIIENILLFIHRQEYIHSLYTERMYGIGKEYRVETGGRVIKGVIKGVTKEGHLILETSEETLTLPSATLWRMA